MQSPAAVPGEHAAADASLTYWQPCLGVPPITVETPAWFLGMQVVAGLASLMALIFVEIAR